MLIKGAILVVLIIAVFFFLGVKMSESITEPGIRVFFFALYFLTIFTVFNIILSFYFIIKLQGKRGPQGKKGLQGKDGDRGEPGTCDKTSCKKKTVELLIRNKIEKDLASEGGLTEAENKVMCAIFKKFQEEEIAINMDKINTLSGHLTTDFTITRTNENKNNADNGIHDFIVSAISTIKSGFSGPTDFNC